MFGCLPNRSFWQVMNTGPIIKQILATLLVFLVTSCASTETHVAPDLTTSRAIETVRVSSTDTPITQIETVTPRNPLINDENPVRIKEKEEHHIQIDYSNWDDYSGEQVLLMLSDEGRFSEEGSISLDFATWNGKHGTIATFSLDANQGISGQSMDIDASEFLARSSNGDAYLLRIAKAEVVGLDSPCEITQTMGVGEEYLVIGCLDSRPSWHFVSIKNLVDQSSYSLPEDFDDFLYLEPVWLDQELVLLIDDFHQVACASSVPDWNPVCERFDFFIGPLSPDTKWLEVRTSDRNSPDQVGYLNTDCLHRINAPCFPDFIQPPQEMITLNPANRFVSDSAWGSESDKLFFIVHVNYDTDTIDIEESEIWELDVFNRSINLLFNIPGEVYFGEPRLSLESGYWDPDGENIVVKTDQSFSLLNINTGQLNSLHYNGHLHGIITLP